MEYKVIDLKEKQGNNIETLKEENKYLLDKIQKLENDLNQRKLQLEKFIPLNDDIQQDDYYNFKDGNINKFYSKILSNKLINKYNLIYFAGDNPYVYRNGVYKESKTILKGISKYISFSDPNAVKNIKDTEKMIMIDSFVDINKINPSNLINFKNGIFNLDTCQLEPHTTKIYSTCQTKANYYNAQNIGDTIFYKFLLDSGCSDNLINLIRQIIGYCLTSYTDAQKMFIIKGIPRTGKSTLLKIMKGLFSRDFTSSINLEDLQKGEYLAQLVGKSINICGDIGQNFIDNTSKILQLTGDESITVRPLYVNPFECNLTAKQVFATNMLPNVNDKTGAFLRRCIIIPFNKKVPEHKTVSNLDKIILEKEADIIASWAIDSFIELKRNNFQFNETKETIIELDTYRKDNNSLELFFDEYCYIDDKEESFITVNEFKNFYKMFCEVENIKMQGYKQVKEFIRNIINLKENKQSKYCKMRHYKNISWQEKIKDLINEKILDDNFHGNIEIKSNIRMNYDEVERDGIKND